MADAPKLDERLAAQLAAALARVRFGRIVLTIHEGRVQDVEVAERTRLSLIADPPPQK